VGPSGSGAHSPRIRGERKSMKREFLFFGALACVLALAALVG
jgi:hypothetical protein